MEDKTFKTHMIYIDYPMNTISLKEMEEMIAQKGVN